MLISLCYVAIAQDNHPVSWKVTGEKTGSSTYAIKMEASVKRPYHIYPQGSSGSGLGMPTQFSFAEDPNVVFVGTVAEKGADQKGNEILPYYANGATFTQTLKLKDEKPTTISFVIKYMACTDQMCLPPSKKQFTVTVGGDSTISTQTANSATAVSNKKTELPYQHFVMANTNGKSVSTKSIIAKNKYTFIDFWASWCAPCRKQARQLVPLYNQYRYKGFAVIGVSLDTETAAWKRAVKDDKYEWINLSDLKGFESPIIKQFGITEIPRNILLNDKGAVVALDLHSDELEAKLAELFKN